jgi:tRNASer (uridine44-2'-O)-methyltransferase
MDYLDYIYKLCKICGFTTKIDKLRIPSTKRICLVGSERNYPEQDAQNVDRGIKVLIDSKTSRSIETISGEQSACCLEKKGSAEKKWVQGVKIRQKEEKVRNCMRLQSGLVEEIVNMVAEQLLKTQQNILVSCTERKERLWNAGGKLALEKVASLIPRDRLRKLKNECGGVQTLLKNNGHIFLVEHGYVQLKVPSLALLIPDRKPISWQIPHCQRNIRSVSRKQKPCWFQFNHPDGCPLPDEDCSYKHASA